MSGRDGKVGFSTCETGITFRLSYPVAIRSGSGLRPDQRLTDLLGMGADA